MCLLRVAIDREAVAAHADRCSALLVVELRRNLGPDLRHLDDIECRLACELIAELIDVGPGADQRQDVAASGLVLGDLATAEGGVGVFVHEDELVRFSLLGLVDDVAPVGATVGPRLAWAAGLAGLQSPLCDEAGQDVDSVVDLRGVSGLAVCDGGALGHPLVVDVHASHVLVEDKAGGAHADGEGNRVKHSDQECLNGCYAVVVGLTLDLFVMSDNSFSEKWIHELWDRVM